MPNTLIVLKEQFFVFKNVYCFLVIIPNKSLEFQMFPKLVHLEVNTYRFLDPYKIRALDVEK